MSNRNSKSRSVFTMDIDGSNVKKLTDNEYYEESPSWSPNGKQIIFTRQLRDKNDTTHAANGEIFIMDSDGSNVKRLTNKVGYDSGSVFSPNGKQIAFYGNNEEKWDIYIMNSDGSELTNLTNETIECYSPSWSPDGKWIVYTAGEKNNYDLWLINVKTKEKRQLTKTTYRNEHPTWSYN